MSWVDVITHFGYLGWLFFYKSRAGMFPARKAAGKMPALHDTGFRRAGMLTVEKVGRVCYPPKMSFRMPGMLPANNGRHNACRTRCGFS